MSVELDYLGAIKRESARFSECLARVAPTSSVPSCPDWTAADLLWHLTEVQLFWGSIVRNRLDDPQAAEDEKPPRPAEYEALQSLAHEATARPLDALDATPPQTAVWTWATDHTAGSCTARRRSGAVSRPTESPVRSNMLTVPSTTAVSPAFTVSGTAADLDRWLWGRGDLRRLDASGDAGALERFTAIIAAGVQ